MHKMEELLGGIEAGGTKFICAIGKQSGEILDYQEIPTTTPSETFDKVTTFFKSGQSITALGIGLFGPVDLDRDSGTYGYVTNTPKQDWANTNIKKMLEALGVPIAIETDVGCAALGEYFYGPAKDYNDFLYVSVGTGVGGAFMIKGELHHEKKHSEMGHIFIPHDFIQDPFDGVCPYHGDCFEGLASGPAIEDRAGEKAEKVIDPFRWDLEAQYLAEGVSSLMMVLNPELIILGGGVMKHGGLVGETTRRIKSLVNNYTELPSIIAASDRNAVLGAIKLASQFRIPG